jgi:putative DNA methylase
MREMQPPEFPMTVFYAFKQTENAEEEELGGGHPGRQVPEGQASGGRASSPTSKQEIDGQGGRPPDDVTVGQDGRPPSDLAISQHASTGWETMLTGLVNSGFAITGTWPMRTELVGNLKKNMSALASSIVLSCRPRPADASLATRREFLSALKKELPDALRHLQQGNIAPVDLAQASIGPGMAIYTRYAKVMEADGSSMPVRQALGIINQMLDEVLAEQEGEFDADTRWAVAWFEQFGMEEGPFGEAETLSRAKNTAVNGLVEAGIISAHAGKVRLLTRGELPIEWKREAAFQGDESRAGRPTPKPTPKPTSKPTLGPAHWEITQYLIRAHDTAGESAAADLLRQLGAAGETARDLAYRLYNICERKKWPAEALAYNSLVIAWPEISKLAAQTKVTPQTQEEMF